MITASGKPYRHRNKATLRQCVACISGVAVCALLMTATACVSRPEPHIANQTQSTQLATDISVFAREELEQTGLASLQIAIAYNGVVVYSDAYGKADIELDVEASPETRYRTASISKWFTATAAMRLVEAGALDLDAAIQKYCPEFPEKAWPITARHLLSHTSGIRHYRDYSNEFESATSDAQRKSVEDAFLRDRFSRVTRYTDVVTPLGAFAEEPLLFEPGTQYLYSSFGYRVLGCVIKGTAGRPYNAVMRDTVFSPAGMDQTVEDDAWAIILNRATGYDLEETNRLRHTDFRDVSENLPAGGHLSTATDLVRFAQAFSGGNLLSDQSLALMLSDPLDKRGDILHEGYGLGVMTFDIGPDPLIGHDGSQAGTSTILFHAMDTNLSVAILTNTRGWSWPRMERFAREVYMMAAERLN